MRALELERRHASGLYAQREVEIVRGAGARVFDGEGRAFLDLTSGHGVAVLGHGHPWLAGVIAEQARTLVTCPAVYANDRRATYVERLCEKLPGTLQRLFLCNSGAEAVEAAIKLARLATGRTGVVATKRGFHGRTFGALSATWGRKYREPFEPLVPDFHHVPFDSIDAVEVAIGEDTACVIVEIVQGEGGVRPGSREYFEALRRLCDERGALLLIDEVQTGFGRTGEWFACEHHDLAPDLICLGKAIAGGVPMGAVGIGDRVGRLPAGAHGSTFGGNPLACAAAEMVLEVIERDGLVERARVLGKWLLERLSAIDSPRVREVRGLGLMVAVELRERATPLLRALLERGVMALPAGSTVIRFLPPLVVSRAELEEGVLALEAVLNEEE